MKTSDIQELFDELESEEIKRAGMAKAVANAYPLQLARDIAEDIAIEGDGTADADRVGKRLQEQHDIYTLGPAAGSIFRGKEWEFTGEWIKSDRKSNHGRMIREWRLV